MAFRTRHTQPSEGELARLADGSLPGGRADELRARVGQSPELTRALAEQEQVVSMLRSIDERAPAALRTRVESMSAPVASPPRWRLRQIVMTAAAVAVVAVLVAVTQGGSALPSVPQTAQLALAPATAGAPVEDVAQRGTLAVAVDHVPFPYWQHRLGWRAVGTRTDVLNARRIVTVYYADRSGARVGYSIVAGPALSTPRGKVIVRHDVHYRLIQDGPLQIVTWLRSGHTCVLAGRGLSEQALLQLASTYRRSLST